MKKQLRILLAGMLIVVPFAITIWIIISVGTWLDSLPRKPMKAWDVSVGPGVGALIVIAAVYLVGLLTHLWAFRWMVQLLEGLFARVPGVKTIYESVRDLLKLFGGDARRMGKAVLYTPQGSTMTMLAILTNEHPVGLAADGNKVAIFLPYSYMFGGITVYVPADCLCEVDIPVEEVLKLCATAQVTPRSRNGKGGEPAGQ